MNDRTDDSIATERDDCIEISVDPQSAVSVEVFDLDQKAHVAVEAAPSEPPADVPVIRITCAAEHGSGPGDESSKFQILLNTETWRRCQRAVETALRSLEHDGLAYEMDGHWLLKDDPKSSH
jgi:hypothetical protein